MRGAGGAAPSWAEGKGQIHSEVRKKARKKVNLAQSFLDQGALRAPPLSSDVTKIISGSAPVSTDTDVEEHSERLSKHSLDLA
jgi:hypothetical protein